MMVIRETIPMNKLAYVVHSISPCYSQFYHNWQQRDIVHQNLTKDCDYLQDLIMYKVGKLNLISIPSRCFTQRRNSVLSFFRAHDSWLEKEHHAPLQKVYFLSHCTSLVDLMTPSLPIKPVTMSLSLMHSSAGASASQVQSGQ